MYCVAGGIPKRWYNRGSLCTPSRFLVGHAGRCPGVSSFFSSHHSPRLLTTLSAHPDCGSDRNISWTDHVDGALEEMQKVRGRAKISKTRQKHLKALADKSTSSPRVRPSVPSHVHLRTTRIVDALAPLDNSGVGKSPGRPFLSFTSPYYHYRYHH